MSLVFFPNMWMCQRSLITALKRAARDTELDMSALLEAHEHAQIDRSLEEGEKLIAHPQCTHELHAHIILANAFLLSEEPDIVAARILVSQGIRDAQKHLGSTHPLTMELRRCELHWMSFTLMEDIAIRRYKKFFKDAELVWGIDSAKYWLSRVESLVPMSHSGSFFPLARRIESVQKGIACHLGSTHLLRYAVGAMQVKRYLNVGDHSTATVLYEDMLTWGDDGDGTCDASASQAGENTWDEDYRRQEDEALSCAWQVIVLTVAMLSAQHGEHRNVNRYLSLLERGFTAVQSQEMLHDLLQLLSDSITSVGAQSEVP